MRKPLLAGLQCFLIGALYPSAGWADVVRGSGAVLKQPTATQLVPSASGTGHILVMPYFNAQAGNATIISITNNQFRNTNTAALAGKVVKVRFRGSVNGDTLASLTVMLAPGDVWNAVITMGSDGIAQFVTSDTSCTLPKMAPGTQQPMLTNRLNPSLTPEQKANQTREGYVEVITMADVPNRPTTGNLLFDTISQKTGAVCDDTVIAGAIFTTNWTSEGGITSNQFARGLDSPTTGIFGKWTIINVPQTTTLAGSMLALRAADSNGVDGIANFSVFAQAGNAYTGAIDNVTSDPLLRRTAFATKSASGTTTGTTSLPIITAAFHDLPDLSTPYVVSPGTDASLKQAARLSGALAVRELTNEWAGDTAISGKTDWVLSMPARRYSLGMDYSTTSTPRALFSSVTWWDSQSQSDTTDQVFHSANTSLRTGFTDQLCTPFRQQVSDRNGNVAAGGPTLMCGAASVFSFADAGTSVLGGAAVRDNFTPGFQNGWGTLDVTNASTGRTMPVMGNSYVKVTNPLVAPGISGNYGYSSEHAVRR